MTSLGLVLSPFELAPAITLRNRVVVPGHTTNFGQGNRPTQRHVDYHAARAAGGAGLIITEAIRVHPTSAGRHNSLGSFDDDSIPAYTAITEAIHAHGAHTFAQIMHAGRQANGDATRTAAWSASPIAWSPVAPTPHAMGRHDIAVLVESFASAARRMAAAGFDGLEVHSGHGHLLQQFLSPATNLRTDGYGGSLEGRIRLTREVLEAVASAAPELPIGLRVSADEFLDGGLRPDDVIEIVDRLRADQPLAYVHVSHSAYHASWTLATQMADMSFDHAPFAHHATAFRRALPGLPVIAVCRLDSLDEAAELLRGGDADLVALARPHIADPELVAKAASGRRARSCLACNQACIARVELSLPISCVVNPEVGAEGGWARAWPALAGRRGRKVLVIGGGPAGLHAAIAADRAGDAVTLVERDRVLGGQVRRAAAIPNRSRLGLLVEDLVAETNERGVRIELGVHLDGDGIDDDDWDDVIVATGSTPSRSDFGAGVAVETTWEAAARLAVGPRLDGRRVVVFDADGGWTGASIVEGYAMLGATVHLVSPHASLAGKITTYSRLALVRRLRDAHVRAHLMAVPMAVGAGEVAVVSTFDDSRVELDGVAAIVDVGRPVAADAIYRQLDTRPAGPRVHVVGDANSPRTALEAVYEGRVAGAFLGADSPESRLVVADPIPIHEPRYEPATVTR